MALNHTDRPLRALGMILYNYYCIVSDEDRFLVIDESDPGVAVAVG